MYIALIVIVLFPWDILTGYNPVTPASALFVGLMFALVLAVRSLNSTRRAVNIFCRLR